MQQHWIVPGFLLNGLKSRAPCKSLERSSALHSHDECRMTESADELPVVISKLDESSGCRPLGGVQPAPGITGTCNSGNPAYSQAAAADL